MFVRFRKYELSSGFKSYRVEVAKSYRDALSGEPRNKVVGYLGTFRDVWSFSSYRRLDFLREAEERLSKLPLTEGDKSKIRAAIERRVRRPVMTLALMKRDIHAACVAKSMRTRKGQGIMRRRMK
jgi:hypothetical protein